MLQDLTNDVTRFVTESSTLKLCCVSTVSVSALCLTWKLMNKRRSRAPPAPPAPRGTVVLHMIPRASYAPNLSPFPIKLEMFLRVAKIPYIVDFSNPLSKKGKVPHMTYNGDNVADSQLCIKYLKDKLHADLNKSLTTEQKAAFRAIQVMVDEHLFWTIAYYRWSGPGGMDQRLLQQEVNVPWVVLKLFQRRFKGQLYSQGMGRHTQEEVFGFMMDDLAALDGYLGDKLFMMGDVITEIDCSVFGHLCQLVFMQEDEVLGGLVQDKFPRLFKYVHKIKDTVWPDWAEVTTKPEKK